MTTAIIEYTKAADKVTQICQTIITLEDMLQAEDTLSKRRTLCDELLRADEALRETIKIKADLGADLSREDRISLNLVRQRL